MGNLLAREGILDSLLPLKLATSLNLKTSPNPKFQGQPLNYPAPPRHLQQTTVKMQISATICFIPTQIAFSLKQTNFKADRISSCCTPSPMCFGENDRNRWWKKLCSFSGVQIRGSRDRPSRGLIVETCGTVLPWELEPIHPYHKPTTSTNIFSRPIN